jgi:hypothetical protein
MVRSWMRLSSEKRPRAFFSRRILVSVRLALFGLAISTADADAQPRATPRPSQTDVQIRADNGRASRTCGMLSVNLRFPNASNLRIMAKSTYQATITMTTDGGIVLRECKKTTRTCYASWQRRDMKRGQNEVSVAAVGSNNCTMSISSYVDVP